MDFHFFFSPISFYIHTISDPVNVHLLPGSDDMINVVADVLRSFFRQLDSPLVPYHIQDRLCAVANMKGTLGLNFFN